MGFRRWFACPLLIFLAAAPGLAAARDLSPGRPPAAAFSKVIESFSGEEGCFLSDNLIPNEDGYLSVLGKPRRLGAGPEQKFTHIAKVRPSIPFLVGLRRQAVIQHLTDRALFHLSKNRADFLSRLLGRRPPAAGSSVGALMDYFADAAPDSLYPTSNLAETGRTIQSEFEFPLSKGDRDLLTNTARSFYRDVLDVSSRFRSPGRGGFGMPSTRELIAAEDFQFVRALHEKNRIIPACGDFAGYLRDHSYAVNAFYAANVEICLFRNGLFGNFVKDVKALATAPGSLFLRSASHRGHWSSPRLNTFRFS
jgi:hypothetical protein